MTDPAAVRAMFARIAPRYDLLNRCLSVGIDQRWRRALLRALGDVRERFLVDVCCGTGDLSFVLERAGARVLGVDFTPAMLRLALLKGPERSKGLAASQGHTRGRGLRRRPRFVAGDALRLPVSDQGADGATIAFGLRNLADREAGLRELMRIVRPGGRVMVLEFSLPQGRLLGAAYRAYFTRVLPRLGGWISGDAAAYRYLPDTVLAWPDPAELQEEMEGLGLERCGFQRLSGGIACLSFGCVPATASVPT